MINSPAPTAPKTKKTAAPITNPVRRPEFASERFLVAAATAGRGIRTTGTTTSSIGPWAAATSGGSSGRLVLESAAPGADAGIDAGVRNGIRQWGQRTTWPSIASGTRAAA